MSKRLSKEDKQWLRETANALERDLGDDVAKDMKRVEASMTPQEKAEYEEYERGLAFEKNTYYVVSMSVTWNWPNPMEE